MIKKVFCLLWNRNAHDITHFKMIVKKNKKSLFIKLGGDTNFSKSRKISYYRVYPNFLENKKAIESRVRTF